LNELPFPFLFHGEFPRGEIAAEMDPYLMVDGFGGEDPEVSEDGDEEAE
jgi:hypothetical protein